MIIEAAKRTESVQEYYFSRKNREIAALNADGRSEPIINLGIGAPDGMPPQDAIDALCENAKLRGVHSYQSYTGIPELRRAFASWYKRYYGVTLDPASQIQPLTGSKEGILIIDLAFLNKGDKVLIPDPGYPTYSSAAKLCEAEILTYELKEENSWQPDFESLGEMELEGVKIMWTNYPGMPTGAPPRRETYERLVEFGLKNNILICNDNPYSFILCSEQLSILSVPEAMECCLELNSLSKAHNMSGWRLGMLAANSEIISQILKVKTQMDSGIFRPLQYAAIKALEQGPEWFEALNAEYRKRRTAACRIMDAIGAKYSPDGTGLFVWGKIEGDAEELSDKILHEAGVFITPGFIFGNKGKNYMRISLCADVEVFEKALERIKKAL